MLLSGLRDVDLEEDEELMKTESANEVQEFGSERALTGLIQHAAKDMCTNMATPRSKAGRDWRRQGDT